MSRSFPSPLDPSMIKKCDAIICTHSHVDHMLQEQADHIEEFRDLGLDDHWIEINKLMINAFNTFLQPTIAKQKASKAKGRVAMQYDVIKPMPSLHKNINCTFFFSSYNIDFINSWEFC